MIQDIQYSALSTYELFKNAFILKYHPVPGILFKIFGNHIRKWIWYLRSKSLNLPFKMCFLYK